MSTDVQNVDERATRLYDDHYEQLASRTHRIFIALLAGQWVFGIVLALLVWSRTWEGLESRVHPDVWYAVIFGGLVAVPPSLLAVLRPRGQATRYAIAVAQMTMGALLISVISFALSFLIPDRD